MPTLPAFRIARHRRAWIGLLGTFAIAGAAVGAPALASNQRPHGHALVASHTCRQSAGPAAREAVAAVQQLANDRTINQHQANAIDGQICAGSVDPKPLVNSGVVTDAQMHAIAHAIDQVKRSFHG